MIIKTNKDLLDDANSTLIRGGSIEPVIGNEDFMRVIQPIPPVLGTGNKLSPQDRYARGIQNDIVGDSVNPQRIGEPLETAGVNLSDYIEFTDITTPGTPSSGYSRLYYNADGNNTDLFVLDSSGAAVELIGNTITSDFTISSATVGSLEINGIGNAAEYSKLALTANSGNSWIWRHEADNDLMLRYYDGSNTTNILQITSAGKLRVLNENLDIHNGKYLKVWDSGNVNAGQIEFTGWGMTLSVSKGDIGLYPQDYTNFLHGPARFFHSCNYQKGTDTIAGGVITKDQSYMAIETQSGAATDDLDTINGGEEGDLLILEALDSTHDVVVKDGTGNINCAGDFTMDHAEDKIMLIFNGSEWDELNRSSNS